MNDELEKEMKALIVEALMLDEITPDEIETEAPLFVDGLGLDSIDALELAIAIEKKWGLKIKASDEEKRKIFNSVRSLSAYVAEHRAA